MPTVKKKYFGNLSARLLNRFVVLQVVTGAIFCVIIVRLFYLQVIEHHYYNLQAKEQHFGAITIQARRGEILLEDSHSEQVFKLATNTTLDMLYVDPVWVDDPKLVIESLSPYLYEIFCSKILAQNYDACLKKVAIFTGETPEEQASPIIQPNKEELIQEIKQALLEKLNLKEVTYVVLKQTDDQKLLEEVRALNLRGIFTEEGLVYANPVLVVDRAKTARLLARKLQLSTEELEAKLIRRSLRYVKLANKIDPEISEGIKQLNLKGVVLLQERWRFYPEKGLAAQVVGFLDREGKGRYGIEERFEESLKGEPGEIIAENDPFGRQITVKKSVIRPASDGTSVVLTLDRVVQEKVEDFLTKRVWETKANSGQVVVVNPLTGEVIAMANYPSFDPNYFGNIYETEEINYDPGASAVVLEDLGENRFLIYKNRFGPEVYLNKIVSEAYEPGSVFKAFTMSSALDIGEVTPQTPYFDRGEVKVDEFTIHNVDKRCYGSHNMVNALNFSCNVGLAFVSNKIGKSLFYKYIHDFGFGARTDIELNGEAKGGMRYFRYWSDAHLATIAFGQGITVTPLQMAMAFSALANGGILIKPQLVKYLIHPDGKIEKNDLEVYGRVVTKKTADTITAMLVSVVENGIAKKGEVVGYFVAGKTGTSQIASRFGGYEEGEGTTTASYGGYVPADNPQFVILVKIDRPRSGIHGSEIAAPLFAQVAKFLMDYYNVPPER